MADTLNQKRTEINKYLTTIRDLVLLYKQGCFTGKYTTHKIYMKLLLVHLGLEWCIFHILTSEDIDNIISPFFTVVCANSQWKMAKDRFVYIVKRKFHGGLKILIIFSRVKNNILLFLVLENKLCIFALPCNILVQCIVHSYTQKQQRPPGFQFSAFRWVEIIHFQL